MVKFKIASFLLILISAAALSASAAPELYEFPNGFRVVFDRMEGTGLVSFGIWAGVGSVHEEDRQAGIAHMLEHMLFKGSRKHPLGEAERIIEALGGSMNGATSFEYTCYFATVLSENFEEAFAVLADMVKNPLFIEEEFASEKMVVLREVGQREDDPVQRSARMFYEAAYPGHFYGRPIIGYRDTIEGLTVDDLKNFHRENYFPGNMLLVVCGDVASNDVLRLASAGFSRMRRRVGRTSPKPAAAAPAAEKIERADIRSSYLWLGAPGPPAAADSVREAAALSLAASVLGSGRSSRLYRSLREDRNLVSSVSAGFSFLPRGGPFFIRTVQEPGLSREVEEAALGEIKSFVSEGPSEQELERAVRMSLAGMVFGLESSSGRLRSLGSFAASGNIEFFLEYVEILKDITAEEVREVSAEYIVPGDFIRAKLLPEEACENDD